MIGFTILSDVIDLSNDQTYIGFNGVMHSKVGSKKSFWDCSI